MAIPFSTEDAENDPAKAAFNKAFKLARTLIENTIGIVKRRFSVLGGILPFRCLDKVSMVIQCLMALHNFVLDSEDDTIETL